MPRKIGVNTDSRAEESAAKRAAAKAAREAKKTAMHRWVKRVMDREGMIQQEFADALGFQRSTIGNYISGERPVPRAFVNRVREIFPHAERAPEFEEEPANIRSKSTSDLTQVERILIEAGTVAIPVWRGVAAGEEQECSFEDDSFEPPKEIPAFFIQGANVDQHVLCIASGYSMEPRILDGERALVRFDPDVPPGHLVVARSPEGLNFIKKLVLVNGRKELHSVNDQYHPISNLHGWSLKGGVVLILKHYVAGQPNMEWDWGRYLRA